MVRELKNINTVFSSVFSHAKESPNKIAVISGKEMLTYKELSNHVAAVATGLIDLRVNAGDRVGVCSDNSLDHLIGVIGVMAMGGIPVALPNHDQVSFNSIIDDALPVLVLGDSNLLINSGIEIPSFSLSVLIERGMSSDVKVNWGERRVNYDDIAMLYYTSGTSSGVRKGVKQSYSQLHFTANYIIEITQLNEEVREFVASSIDNAFWFGRCRCVLQVGGTLILHTGTLNPLAVIDSIKRNDGNAISGDTPVFLLLLKYVE